MNGYLYAIAGLGVFTYRGEASYLSYPTHNVHRKFVIHLVNMGIISGPYVIKTVIKPRLIEGIRRTIAIIRRYCTRTNIIELEFTTLK